MWTANAILIGLVVASAESEQGACAGLHCRHDAPCVKASPDLSEHDVILGISTNDAEEERCACPRGWAGKECEIPHVYCGTDDQDFKCYHGGVCDGSVCSCSSAVDMFGTSYVGSACQHRVVVTCDDEATRFCVNGGVCAVGGDMHSHPCHCDKGFTGQHCEFAVDSVLDCTLGCRNGGECRLGFQNYTQAQMLYTHDYWMFALDDDDDNEYQYCLCPSGFVGPLCEDPGIECGKDNFCYHESTCVFQQGKHQCKCRTNHAGKSCEFEATTFCESSEGFFCVSHGECDEKNQTCHCPLGFTGRQCEIPDPFHCTTSCLNGGHCRKGSRDYGTRHDGLVVATNGNTNNDDGSSSFMVNFEHCVCPPLYSGPQCEIPRSYQGSLSSSKDDMQGASSGYVWAIIAVVVAVIVVVLMVAIVVGVKRKQRCSTSSSLNESSGIHRTILAAPALFSTEAAIRHAEEETLDEKGDLQNDNVMIDLGRCHEHSFHVTKESILKKGTPVMILPVSKYHCSISEDLSDDELMA